MTTPEKPAAASSTNATTKAVLQEFDDYSKAQQLVDRLSDSGFPVEHLQFVGTGIRTHSGAQPSDSMSLSGHPSQI